MPSRHRIVLLLAAVLALHSADTATVDSAAQQIREGLALTRTDLGLVVTVSGLVGALAAVPFGILADRVVRVRLLAIAVMLWGAGAVFTGWAWSLPSLLAARALLGVVLAASGPVVASLIGDWFPSARRGRIYSRVLTGELVGTGIGFVATGNVATLLSWRWSFWLLAAPAVPLAVLLWRLPEPSRGGQPDSAEQADAHQGAVVQRAVARARIEPDADLARAQVQAGRSLLAAARVILQVRTNLALIVGSALGYSFLSAVQTFGVGFATERFHLSHAVVTSLLPVLGIGVVAGVLLGGRYGDHLVRQGHVSGQVRVGVIAFAGSAVVYAPAFFLTSAWLAAPFLVVASGLLGSANPPVDAARLDVLHPSLWGRGEAVRSVLRGLGESFAPLAFGLLTERVFGGGVSGTADAFVVLLLAMLAAAGVLVAAMRSYPRDVATATEARRLSRPQARPASQR